MKKLIFLVPFLLFFHWFDPSSMLVERGNSLFKADNYRGALNYYLKALKRRDRPEIHFNIGCALYMMGNYNESEKEFEKYLRFNQDYRAVFNIGNIYFREGNYRDAIEKYKNALRLNPYFYPAKVNIEIALSKLRVEKSPSSKAIPDVIMEFLKKKEKEVFKKKWRAQGKSGQKDW